MTMDYDARVTAMRRANRAGALRTADDRLDALRTIDTMLRAHDADIKKAVFADIKRSGPETHMYELAITYGELKTAMDSVREWMRPEACDKPLLFALDTPEVHSDAKGVVLVMGAWNYPVNLTVIPMINAIAAGNSVIIKPSEIAEHSAALLKKLIEQYFSSDVCQVWLGGPTETTEMLKIRFDHIIYTGSTHVGRIVMAAAAKHLTPVTLELGGKSPAIVDATCDLELCARRLAWGKFVSAGQTCLAPDYVMVVESVRDDFVQHLVLQIEDMYGKEQHKAADYTRIISRRHYDRLTALLGTCDSVVYGGDTDADDLYIRPTICLARRTDKIMEGEIFGPILPIVTVASVDEAIGAINEGPKPLALYIFSKNRDTQDAVLRETSSGAVTINDCILHCGCDTLPFGGVGDSGLGAYHGKHGFDTFSHKKAVLRRAQGGEALLWIRYPPLTEQKFKWVKMLSVRRPFYSVRWARRIATFLFGSVFGLVLAWLWLQRH